MTLKIKMGKWPLCRSSCCSEPHFRFTFRNVVLIRNKIVGGGQQNGEIQELCQGLLGFKTQPTGSSEMVHFGLCC